MKAVVLANFHLISLTCVALLLFFSLFVGALFWVFRKSSKSFYASLAELPLREDH